MTAQVAGATVLADLATMTVPGQRATTAAWLLLALLAAGCGGEGGSTATVDQALGAGVTPATAAVTAAPTAPARLPAEPRPTATVVHRPAGHSAPSTAPATTTTTVAPTTSTITTVVPTTSTTAAPTTSTVAPPPPSVSTALPVPVEPPLEDGSTDPPVELGAIEIPRIGLQRPLEEGIRLSTLDRGPGHWPGTAMPGDAGNVVIAGHRVSHHADFRHLDQLVPGDEVIITTAAGRFVYQVQSTEVVGPEALWIVDQTAERTATLFACHPPGSTRQRIVVHLAFVNP